MTWGWHNSIHDNRFEIDSNLAMSAETAGHVYGKLKWTNRINFGSGFVLLALAGVIFLALYLEHQSFSVGSFVILSLIALIIFPIGCFLLYRAKVEEKSLPIEITSAGIRNLGPSASPIVLWDEIYEIEPRPGLQWIEVKNKKTARPVLIDFHIREFEEVATHVVSRACHLWRRGQSEFDAGFLRGMPVWIVLLVIAVVFVANGLIFNESIPRAFFTGVLPVAFFVGFRTKAMRPIRSIDIGNRSIKISRLGKTEEVPYEEVVSVSVVSIPRYRWISSERDVDVALRLRNDETLSIVPARVDPCRVFWAIKGAWEEWRKENPGDGVGKSAS
jgi:hypothetical protein